MYLKNRFFKWRHCIKNGLVEVPCGLNFELEFSCFNMLWFCNILDKNGWIGMVGNCCSSTGKVVSSDTWDPWFESYPINFNLALLTYLCQLRFTEMYNVQIGLPTAWYILLPDFTETPNQLNNSWIYTTCNHYTLKIIQWMVY